MLPSPVHPPIGTLDSQLNMVWWDGQSAIAAVPPYLIAINGHNYLEDLEFKPWKRQAMRATTTQTTRTQADTSNEPGEQSLSTESLWRRTQDSWHLGAGQVFLDRKNSTEFGFRSSKGVNPWTQWQLTLLNDVTKSLTSANTNLQLCVCGSFVYLIDGTNLKYTVDMVTWTTVTGMPGTQPSSLTSDGNTVWVTCGTSGVYFTVGGTASASQYTTTAISSSAVIRFVMGRLMLGTGNFIYNITGSGALPGSPLMSSLYANIVFKDFAAGNGVIFVAGNSGNVGVIYSIQIEPDGTTLASPIVCGQLPNGETVNAIYGYAGSGLAIGSNLGFRFSEQALANGVAGTVSLTIGPLFPLPHPVVSFSGYNRFIWGTYQNYDNTSTGLFRMDPTQFVSDLAPAYASDLMATTQGVVSSVIHWNGNPTFAVQGVGIYTQASTYVSSGTIDSGFITYGLADNKMPVFVDDQILALPSTASVNTYVSLDGGGFVTAGSITSAGVTFSEFNTPQVLSQTMEIRQILKPTGDTTISPTLVRHTIRSVPAPPVPTDWTVVIQLRERYRINDVEVPLVPSQEYAYLDNLRAQKIISILQIGNMGPFSVTLETIDFIPEQRGSVTGELNGVCVITARTVV